MFPDAKTHTVSKKNLRRNSNAHTSFEEKFSTLITVVTSHWDGTSSKVINVPKKKKFFTDLEHTKKVSLLSR